MLAICGMYIYLNPFIKPALDTLFLLRCLSTTRKHFYIYFFILFYFLGKSFLSIFTLLALVLHYFKYSTTHIRILLFL